MATAYLRHVFGKNGLIPLQKFLFNPRVAQNFEKLDTLTASLPEWSLQIKETLIPLMMFHLQAMDQVAGSIVDAQMKIFSLGRRQPMQYRVLEIFMQTVMKSERFFTILPEVGV